MKILIKKARKLKNIEQSGMINNRKAFETFALPLTATWGKVLKAHSEDNTVDVQLSGGMELYHIVVRSLEWAGADTAGYGERDLPPVDCIVLILFPDSIIENAFVLCSILSTFEQVGAKHKVELLASGKESEHLRIREGKKTILKINGATITVNTDGSVEIDPASGKIINIAGNTKNFVTHAELDTALQTFLTALKAAVSSGCQSGSGGNIASVTLDISIAEATKVKTS